jgi:hypothetical protein
MIHFQWFDLTWLNGSKVRIADLERVKMLRNCSNVCFGEAAARRRKVPSMSAMGRSRNFAKVAFCA